MTPREHLEQELANKKAGGPAIQALSDMMSLRYAEMTFNEFIQQDERDDDRKMPDYQFVLLSFEIVTLKETIRKRQFGKNGGEYNKAWQESERYLKPYFDNILENTEQVILEDLKEINDMKSKRSV